MSADYVDDEPGTDRQVFVLRIDRVREATLRNRAAAQAGHADE